MKKVIACISIGINFVFEFLCKDSFETLQEASDDYKLKLELDKKGYFDDRFVLYVEDDEGGRVNVKI